MTATQVKTTEDSNWLEESIRYLVDSDGEKTDVIVPIELWERVLAYVQTASGLDPIDELEPHSHILEGLKTSLREVEEGKVFPISELWDDIEDQNHD